MKKWKVVVAVLVILMIGGGVVGFQLFEKYKEPILNLNQGEKHYLYIPTGADYQTVLDSLERPDLLRDVAFFKLIAERKNYPNKVKPGRYKLESSLNANALVNKLRSGNQDPINVTFNNKRFASEIVSDVSSKLELDSFRLYDMMANEEIMESYGFDRRNFTSMFLPDTYQFFWNTSEEEFLDRMKKQYDQFWTEDRKAKAKDINLSIQEVSVLASIVQMETNKRDEQAKVAGLYINRLKKGILLQADPTVKFALGNFGLTRILFRHLEYDSPYNTYKYAGLPPGPICMPDKITIDHVLNYERHNYIYMCAKDDGSGYHAFARNLREHNRNAAAYHRWYREWRRKNR
jgi:UPF0755 protein